MTLKQFEPTLTWTTSYKELEGLALVSVWVLVALFAFAVVVGFYALWFGDSIESRWRYSDDAKVIENDTQTPERAIPGRIEEG
ncbi:hypothetical protein LCGC14_1698450 [marine sediment metagenome]|uniref:Uncharacterized protein n=1 Tax=marine sediment metagenome TaxID=412755 RepID=A0A0F9KIQ0_9ZZZZ